MRYHTMMEKKSKYTLYIYMSLFCILLLASCGAEKNMKKGEKLLALGEYYDAAEQYKQAYRKTDNADHVQRGKCALKMALCYDKINASQKASAAYANAIRYGAASLDDRLKYARILLRNGEYRKAEKEFQVLADSMPDNTLVKNGLESARMAPQWKKEGSSYEVKRMNGFNSRRDDYSPMLFGDDYDKLYFTSTRNEAQGDELSGITGTKAGDIFVSEKDDKGKWGKPEAVASGLNTDYDEGACAFTPDGQTMYLTQCVTDPSYPRYAQIVTSQRSDASWGKAEVLKLTNDTLSAFAHPAVSPDGEWLYFVSDMPGGKGGLDIWRVRISGKNIGGVENLGAPINTEGDEEFPTFRPNGDLYFSSNGHPGLGGLDIFCAKVDPETHRYVLSHPGYPLNSEGDDFGMTFEGPHNRGFFSSNRKDGRGYDNIFSFNNPEVVQTIKGWVYEMDGYELTQAEVHIVGNDGTNKKLGVRGDGSFTEVVKPGVDYIVMATCKGFLNHKEELHIAPSKKSEEYTLQFALPSITAPVLIDNIFYDFNKASLTDSSSRALDSLVNLLNENPNITIELAAHTDYKGSNAYNQQLSQRRAESVVNYLIHHGIAADRLTPKGYGEEQPKTIRKKVARKYPWLKEGDKLTEEFVLKQTAEHQEICNQLNRRTEFRVLRTTYGLFDDKGQLKAMPKPKKHVDADDGDSDAVFDDVEITIE